MIGKDAFSYRANSSNETFVKMHPFEDPVKVKSSPLSAVSFMKGGRQILYLFYSNETMKFWSTASKYMKYKKTYAPGPSHLTASYGLELPSNSGSRSVFFKNNWKTCNITEENGVIERVEYSFVSFILTKIQFRCLCILSA